MRIAGLLLLVALTGCGTSGDLVWNKGFGPTGSVAAKPTFSPTPGTYTTAQTVTISDITPGATISYTTDGTTPIALVPIHPASSSTGGKMAMHTVNASTDGTMLASPSNGDSVQIQVATNETIKAIAVESDGDSSAIASADYTITSAGVEKVEHCEGGVLPEGDINTDLEIDGVSCVVDGKVNGGTYVYRDVNIWGGGSLNFADAKINFHAHSILVENGGSLVAGGSVPAVGPITIWLYGAADDGIPPITCKSGPTCGVPENIWNSNPSMAMHVKPTGKCKPASSFGPSPVGKDCFYRYDPLDQDAPENAYFSRKSLALSYGGTIYLRGAKGILPGPIDKTPSDSGTSWVRLTDTLKGGETSFHVDRPVPTWGYGDHIVLTSTDYLPSHSEELVIQSVESDAKGTKITLQNPVKFPHNGDAFDFSSLPPTTGPRDDPNRPATLPSRHLETRAAVALLTRSIMIASEGATPVLSGRDVDHFPATSYYGGQTIMRQGFATYQVQGVEFYHLGQGGVIGRYPVHFHMDRMVPQPSIEPPFDGTYIADSSIHDSMTRFITVHATQGLLIARNVGYRSIGHGFYLEDATEIDNRLYSNIGIEARAAVDDALNPRKVPGILARLGPDPVQMGNCTAVSLMGSIADGCMLSKIAIHRWIFIVGKRIRIRYGVQIVGKRIIRRGDPEALPRVGHSFNGIHRRATGVPDKIVDGCNPAATIGLHGGIGVPCLVHRRSTDDRRRHPVTGPAGAGSYRYVIAKIVPAIGQPEDGGMVIVGMEGEDIGAGLARRGGLCGHDNRSLYDVVQLGRQEFRRRMATRLVVSIAR